MPQKTSTSQPQEPLRSALLTVELELMRQPGIARLRADRRAAVARDVLDALHAAGFVTGIPELEARPLLAVA